MAKKKSQKRRAQAARTPKAKIQAPIVIAEPLQTPLDTPQVTPGANLVLVKNPVRPAHKLGFVLVVAVLVVSAWGVATNIQSHSVVEASEAPKSAPPATVIAQANALASAISAVEQLERSSGHQLVSNTALEAENMAIRTELGKDNYILAFDRIISLQNQLANLRHQLAAFPAATPTPTATPLPTPPPGSTFLPILLYHNPPADLATELTYLKQHNYTTVDMDEVAAILTHHEVGPAKPIAITFDDGLETQWSAYQLLLQYHMKATFYIIDGGAGSDWHIGANRVVPDPQGGPDYLTWDQVRQIDQSGLVTIGSHTINHLDLAQQNGDIQSFEIEQGKQQLEDQIGHSVDTFAYPYGSYNATTLQIVSAAGFTTAVTTNASPYQYGNALLTLSRVRSAIGLP